MPSSASFRASRRAGRVAYRGTLVDYIHEPRPGTQARRVIDDGVLVIEDGCIEQVGAFDSMVAAVEGIAMVDCRGQILMPGFIDTHIHYPQTEMIASHGEQLLEWLTRYTFPAERRFADADHAAAIADFFLDELLRNGTTTAVVLGSVHRASADAIFDAAARRGVRLVAGQVMMDRHAPVDLCDTPQSAYDDALSLIETWHEGAGTRLHYAVTPRFAATSSPEQLEVVARLREQYPSVFIHTHWAENRDEVEWVRRLFPRSTSYLRVYDDYGLLGPRTVLAHGIHVDQDDRRLLHERESVVAFCPTSNLFLGSGLFDLRSMQASGVCVTMGTDVGAGTSFSMLRTMAAAYEVSQLRRSMIDDSRDDPPLDVDELLYLATLGAARALGLDRFIGNFDPGKDADFIALDPTVTPLLDLRTSRATSLQERLFAMVMIGDDRVIRETYIQGRPSHPPA